MKHLLFTFFFIALYSCNLNPKQEEENTSNEDSAVAVPLITKDSIIPIEETVVSLEAEEDSFFLNADLKIYSLYQNHFENENSAGFIPLADSYKWSDHKDSLAVDNQYLGMTEYQNDNYHVLENEFRSRFLEKLGIDEKDKIFVYDISLDSICVYQVDSISLVAFISPYGAQWEVSQYDYQIGFEMKNLELSVYFPGMLVYIGQNNPFEKGGLVPLSWTEITNDQFPSSKLESQDSTELYRYDNQKVTRSYTFDHGGLNYYVQNLGHDGFTGTRLVKVFSATSQELVFTEVYNDSEGSYLIPLNGIDTQENNWQWTGKLFKNKPPVLFGFLGMSFGCPGISFLDESEPKIWIRCDNRH